MADVPESPPDRITGRSLDAAARERLLAVLRDELTRASHEALAGGMSPEELAAQIEERIGRLRAQIADLSADQT